MEQFVASSGFALVGDALKASEGWTGGPFYDTFGFSAEPKGFMYGDDDSKSLQQSDRGAYFWTSSSGRHRAIGESGTLMSEGGFDERLSNVSLRYLSIRCVKD